MITKRHFPFEMEERAFVLSAIDVAITILKGQGQATDQAEALREELADEETILKLQEMAEESKREALDVWEMAGSNVIDFQSYRKQPYRSHQEEIDEAVDWLTNYLSGDARNGACDHKFVAADRHGDELICELCGAWKED